MALAKKDEQPWLTYTPIGTASENPSPTGGVNLNTTPSNSTYAGYSNYDLSSTLKNSQFPQLDPITGFTISFSVQLNSESHTGNSNRAGFSIIALSNSSDRRGIELGFQLSPSGNIFAQGDGKTANFSGQTADLFSAAENTSYSTGSATNYTLSILNNNYQLFANNAPLLSGPLRDYSNFNGNINPYKTPNFLFFGDDTTSAQANINLGSISVNTNTAAVPYEFSPTWGILTVVAWGAAQLKNKKP